jgi:Xanthine and CO dehydrogenases maturation factor, XdhC/CoxF family
MGGALSSDDALADEDVLATAKRWHADGRRVAVATVVATWGSSPRPAGSQLVVDDQLRFAGSVSGGCVETAVIEAARTVMASGVPQLLEFGVGNDLAWSVGLACGGRIQVFVEPIE